MDRHAHPVPSEPLSESFADVSRPFGKTGWRQWPWLLGTGVTVGLACLIAGGAMTQLLGGQATDCNAATDAPPAAKIYCAQELAGKQTAADLVDALRLVNAIPADHPLRAEGDRRLNEWSQELLRLAENLYQDGKLEDAIAAVRSIPTNAQAYAQVNRQVKQWQTTWDKAEALYSQSQKAIDERQWWKSLSTARQILALNQHYWETVKYPELMAQLDAARGSQEGPVRRQQSLGKDVVQNWQQRKNQLAATALAKAEALAKSGNAPGLKQAIAEASKVLNDAPQSKVASSRIRAWEQQLAAVEDRPYLQRGIALAADDNVQSLRQAMAEAGKISPNSPLHDQAQGKIQQWRDRAQQLQLQAQQPAPAVLPANLHPVLPPAPSRPVLPPPVLPAAPHPAAAQAVDYTPYYSAPLPNFGDTRPVDKLPTEFELPPSGERLRR